VSDRRRAWLLIVALLPFALLLLACVGLGGVATTAGNESPRWACPSPMPMPYGESGPVKRYDEGEVDPTTGIPRQVPVYYQEWEREYGPGGALLGGQVAFDGPPFPSPTPYALVGTRYAYGQRVQVEPLYAQVAARADKAIGTRQLYIIDMNWHNPTGAAIPIDYGAQVRLSAIKRADGGIAIGEAWAVSAESLAAIGTGSLPRAIAPGDSQVALPILAPPGTPYTVDVLFTRDAARAAAAAGAPTPVLSADTPTPNAGLRDEPPSLLVVQWTNAELRIGPRCDDPGAMTPWEASPGVAWGEAALPGAAPPGASRVVQLALRQVGKPYVWGAEGPETFDCSGLMQWAYSQAGLSIPRTAQTQHDGLKPIPASALQPGDLVFFTPRGRDTITHVAMYIGDQDGDGRLDIVHAMSPRLGIRVTYGAFESSYYSGAECELCIAGFGTAR
jgi:cell wall-associated NlpC family hydrolase